MVPAIGGRFRRWRLTEKIVLARGCQRGVRVGGANHAKLVGVGTQLRLLRETQPEGRTCVFVLQHVGRLRFDTTDIALVPSAIVGKFIVGRQEGQS